MQIDSRQLLVSLAPEELEVATQFDVGIELKFDWEHEAILSGERSLVDAVESAGIAPSRVESIHLPPGTTHRHGMAVTPANRGRIIDFVHSQLPALPDAYLTVHPPKQFEYREQMRLLEKLPAIVDRTVSIENLPAECQWHSIPALAYYAHLFRTADRLAGVQLTIDSAHLPAEPRQPGAIHPLADDWAKPLSASLASQDLSLPDRFVRASNRRLAGAVEEYLDDRPLSEFQASRWTPLVQTVFLAADQIKSIHLNDPETDTVPDTDPHGPDRLLEIAIECALDHGVRVVIEPGGDPLEGLLNTISGSESSSN